VQLNELTNKELYMHSQCNVIFLLLTEKYLDKEIYFFFMTHRIILELGDVCTMGS